MKKRQFKKHFKREHVKAHQQLEIKDNLLDLAEELQARREIAEEVGLHSSSTVHKYLTELAEQKVLIYKGVRQIRLLK